MKEVSLTLAKVGFTDRKKRKGDIKNKKEDEKRTLCF